MADRRLMNNQRRKVGHIVTHQLDTKYNRPSPDVIYENFTAFLFFFFSIPRRISLGGVIAREENEIPLSDCYSENPANVSAQRSFAD